MLQARPCAFRANFKAHGPITMTGCLKAPAREKLIIEDILGRAVSARRLRPSQACPVFRVDQVALSIGAPVGRKEMRGHAVARHHPPISRRAAQLGAENVPSFARCIAGDDGFFTKP